MCVEMETAGLRFARQVAVPVFYKGQPIGEHRIDLMVEDTVVVEVKAVTRMEPVFEAQVLTYLKVTGKRVGLLINFHSRLLMHGVKRFVL